METFSALLALCEVCGESTLHRWIPVAKASDTEIWLFLSAPEQTIEQTMETPVTWDAIVSIMTSL